jgi:hypothetical protein
MLPSYRGASLLGSLIPANSKTVRRSRQLPRSAPSIAARTRSISFSCRSRSCKSRSGFFRSFGAGLFAGFVPRLAPWAAFFCRSAAGSVAAVFCDASCCAGCGSAFASRWATGFAVSRTGVSAPHGPKGGRIRGVRSGIGGRSRGLRAPWVVRWPGNERRRSERFLHSLRRCAGLE